MKTWFKENWFKVIAISILLGAIGDNPYGYYQFLRFVITAIGIYSAYLAYHSKRNFWMWIFIAIAILFNPIVPFYLERDTWQVFDVLVAGIFLVNIFKNKNQNI